MVLSVVDHVVECSHVVDVGLIRDDTNAIAQKNLQLFASSWATLFNGSLNTNGQVDTPAPGGETESLR